MRRKQRHTRRRRHPFGCTRRGENGRGFNKGSKEFFAGAGGLGHLAGLHDHDPRGLVRCGQGPGRSRRQAARHAAGAIATTAAALVVRARQRHWLHLRKRGANNGEKDPDQAFHTVDRG